MPQQINLHHAALSAPRRHLQAHTLAIALALWSAALLALGGFSLVRSSALRAELAQAGSRHQTMKVQLAQVQAARQAAAGHPAALQEETHRLTAQLAERRHLLALLEGHDPNRAPTRLLGQLAAELPAPVWLTEIRWTPAQVELAGRTSQPEALQAWLRQRGAPRTLTVERYHEAAAGESAHPRATTARTGGELWAFRLREEAPAPAASGPAAQPDAGASAAGAPAAAGPAGAPTAAVTAGTSAAAGAAGSPAATTTAAAAALPDSTPLPATPTALAARKARP